MKTTKTIIHVELVQRINKINDLLESAKECLIQEDFTQCVVRLELIAEQGIFIQTFKDICEAETEPDTEK